MVMPQKLCPKSSSKFFQQDIFVSSFFIPATSTCVQAENPYFRAFSLVVYRSSITIGADNDFVHATNECVWG